MLTMPAYKLGDGQAYPGAFPDFSPPTAFGTWETTASSWTGKPTVYGDELPLAWTKESLLRVQAAFQSYNQLIFGEDIDPVVIEPTVQYGSRYSLIRKPKIVLIRPPFLSGTGGLDDLLYEFIGSQLGAALDTASISVYRYDYPTAGFIAFGLPPTSGVTMNAPITGDIGTTIECDTGRFLGGTVFALSFSSPFEYFYTDLSGDNEFFWTDLAQSDIDQLAGAVDGFDNFTALNFYFTDSTSEDPHVPVRLANHQQAAQLCSDNGSPIDCQIVDLAGLSDTQAQFDSFKTQIISKISAFFGLP